MSDVFISYARDDDEPFVRRLHAHLVASGMDVWWDRRAMQNRGRTFLQELRDAIEETDRVLAVIGPQALKSDYVRAEWRHAALFSKVVVAVLRAGGFESVPEELGGFHGVDCRPGRSEREALAELVRILRQPVVEPSPLLAPPPPLPPHFLPRPNQIESLVATVLADTVQPTVITSQQQVTALQGMGGIGKSVLATALARSTRMRRSVRDGVLWITLGDRPDLLAAMRQIARAIDDDLSDYAALDAAQQRLARRLQDKSCLLVLDDVWDVRDTTPFLNALGPACRLVITTRDRGLVTAVGAMEHSVELLDEPLAMSLLSDWSGQPLDALPSAARRVAAECGGLPFALAICGAMVRDGELWSDLLEAFQEFDLPYLRKQFPHYEHADLLRSMAVSIQALEASQPHLANGYLQLTAFAEAEAIPEAAVCTLWRHSQAISEREARGQLAALERKALLRLEGHAPSRQVKLHDLHRDYLRHVQEDPAEPHSLLLEAYSASCQGDWSQGPDDGYFFENLPRHLKAADRAGTLRDLLLDARWIRAKLRATGSSSLAADYDLCADDVSTRLVQRALRMSANVVDAEPRELASHLTSRLQTQDLADIRRVLDALAATESGEWLRPLNAGLAPPGGRLLRTLSGHEHYVNCVAYSPDDRLIASGASDSTVRIWDADTGLQLHVLTGHRGWVRDVAFVPDAQVVVSVGDDHAIRFWHVGTGESLGHWHAHQGHIRSLALTSDGSTLVTASSDCSLLVWDRDHGRVRHHLRGHASEVAAVIVLGDDRRAVSAAGDSTVRVWDLRTGEQELVIDVRTGGFCLAASPDDRYLAVDSGRRELAILDLRTEKAVRTLKGHESFLNAARFLQDGKSIISASEDKTLRLWNFLTGEEVDCLTGHSRFVTAVSVSGDDRRAVSASRDGTLKIWDLEHSGPSTQPTWHRHPVEYVLAPNDAVHAMSADSTGKIKVWAAESGREVARFDGQTDYIHCLASTRDGRYLLSAGDSQSVRCWDLRSGRLRWERSDHDRAVWRLAMSPDQRLAASASTDGQINVWRLRQGTLMRSLVGHLDTVWDMVFVPNSTHLVTVSEDGTLKRWDWRSGQLLKDAHLSVGALNAVRLFPSGTRAMVASANRVGLVCDLATGCVLDRLDEQGWKVFIIPTPIGEHQVLIPTDQVDLVLWDLRQRREIRRFVGHAKCVVGTALLERQRRLVSAGQDGSIRVWDFDTGECVASFQGESSFHSLAVRPDGFLIAGEYGGQVHLLRWEVGPVK